MKHGTYEAHELVNKALVIKKDYKVMLDETLKVEQHDSLTPDELETKKDSMKGAYGEVAYLYEEVITDREEIPQAIVNTISNLWDFHLNFIDTRAPEGSALKVAHGLAMEQYETTMALITKEAD